MTSVALVVLDTLRKDLFDSHFEWLPGRRYERCYATANWTAPAHGSLFTGRYPSEIDVHAKAPALDTDQPVLPELLRDSGVTTRCWTANPNLSREFNYDRGFEEFVDSHVVLNDGDNTLNWAAFSANHADEGLLKYPKAVLEAVRGDYDTIASLHRGLQSITTDGQLQTVPDDGARSILRRVKQTDFGSEEFLFINLMEAHSPYNPPEGYGDYDVDISITYSLGLEQPPDDARPAYKAAVAYLSDVYQDIYSNLADNFDYVITLSDHGEMLGEHGQWGHTYGLYPEITHVPLVVSGPGLEGKSNATVGHNDVHRTILSLFSCQSDGRGESLFQVGQGGERFAEYHGLVPTAVDRLTEENVPADRIQAYESSLVGLAAPPDYYGYETPNGIRTIGDCANRMRRIAEWSRKIQQASNGMSSDTFEITQEQERRLEDLGYM